MNDIELLAQSDPLRFLDVDAVAQSPTLDELFREIVAEGAVESAQDVGHTRSQHRHRGIPPRPRILIPVVVLIAVIAATASVLASGGGSVASSEWRLVSSISSPFRALATNSSVGQVQFQCVTDEVCYSPGYGLTDSNDLYQTTDGGRTWRRSSAIPLRLSGYDTDYSCSTVSTCVVVSGLEPSLKMAVTTDGGRHWHTEDVPVPPGIPNAHFGPISCVDGLTCVVNIWGGSGLSTFGRYLTTFDGGAKWSEGSHLQSDTGIALTLKCSYNGECVALAELNFDVPGRDSIVALHSRDWGATWEVGNQTAPLHAGIVMTSCGDGRHCLIVQTGEPFTLTTTSNAGVSWRASTRLPGWLNTPTAVDCANGSHCWIAMSEYDPHSPLGSYSRPNIEMTTNFGTTWSALPLPSHRPAIADVLALACPPSGNGCVAVGNLADHFAQGPRRHQHLSYPLLLSNLPTP
jgi:photosystem II stability/assembly factor-like uncharacterized protein